MQPHRALGEPRHGRYDLWVRSSTPPGELAPAVEMAKRYCWVTNTLATPPEIPTTWGRASGSVALSALSAPRTRGHTDG